MNVIPTWFKALLIGALIGFVLHQVYEAGAETERSKWVLKKALQTVSNQVELAKKNRDLRVLENRLASQALETFTFYQGVFNEIQAKKQSTLAGVRNGTVRLSVPVTGPTTNCQSTGSGSASDRPEATGETRAELSREAAEFLISYGSEFDEVVNESNQVKALLADCRAALTQQQSILKE
ncbi:lysis system i-spanin subunit Rz [Methylophilus aquaticus]|uniref:Lysis system i-spanin subunit Rz n=1 Tax=Methylophilus aquaticus TaxID=1971610 RepID=A0ABT9JTK3_9PROT|nr:lysis system i-spanin subunit Rz [Methylophilus aquaticus]MDP8567917.1 lysis system i-spanin subunit Rz [Methylophilus aquaticus]